MGNAVSRFARAVAAKFGYNGAVATDRRQAPRTRTAPEDSVLPSAKRARLVETARDIERNLTVLQWCIEKHVSYLTAYEYRCQTPATALHDRVEWLVRQYGKKANCDVTKRHSLDGLLALIEGRRTADGDVFVHFTDRGRIQLLESDRVAKPGSWPASMAPADLAYKDRVTDHGLVLDEFGATEAYCVCRYDKDNALVFERFISAEYVEQVGYFTRYNQTRGISPLAGALNASQDLGELTEYIITKVKNDALQGFAFSRDNSDPLDDDLLDVTGATTTDPSEVVAEAKPTEYELPTGVGPFIYDLDAGDKVDLLSSATPNANIEPFCNHIIRQILLGLEIPYCFYDQESANYKSYVAARYDYNATIARKRKPLTELLDRITDWRIRYWMAYDVSLAKLVEAAGIDTAALLEASEWLPLDLPPTSRLDESRADALDISLGLTSRKRICRKRGLRFEDNIRELGEEQDEAGKAGVVLSSGLQPGAEDVQTIIDQQGAD